MLKKPIERNSVSVMVSFLPKVITIDYSEQEIQPIMPNREIIQHLQVDAKQPILKKITRSFLQDGRIFELSCNYFNSSDYRFTLIARRAPKPSFSTE